ncbi:MAG: ATP-binding protein [Candidatus Accumulibacter sp. UW20]
MPLAPRQCQRPGIVIPGYVAPRSLSVNKSQILTLAGLDFLRRGENLLLIGPQGTGNSGIAIGLVREACLNGYRARFYHAQDLLDELYASLADRSIVQLIKNLSRIQLIAIDELGYLNLKPEHVNAFFRLMDQRYTQGLSTIITTNLERPDWYELFQKKALVDALLDRLQHRCILLRLRGPCATCPSCPPRATLTRQRLPFAVPRPERNPRRTHPRRLDDGARQALRRADDHPPDSRRAFIDGQDYPG